MEFQLRYQEKSSSGCNCCRRDPAAVTQAADSADPRSVELYACNVWRNRDSAQTTGMAVLALTAGGYSQHIVP